jgi:ABC-type multidrug transport system fused ATPase/permease subunit
MLSYIYPLFGAFWSILFFFGWVMWLFLLFRIFADIFRSDDLGGFAKALWLIFVILVPFLGVFVYVIARGGSMTRRDVQRTEAQQQQFDSYVRDAAGSVSTADELDKLAQLRVQGVLTDEEFAAQKARVLG